MQYASSGRHVKDAAWLAAPLEIGEQESKPDHNGCSAWHHKDASNCMQDTNDYLINVPMSKIVERLNNAGRLNS